MTCGDDAAAAAAKPPVPLPRPHHHQPLTSSPQRRSAINSVRNNTRQDREKNFTKQLVN